MTLRLAHTQPAPLTDAADVVVVGTGPAGAAAGLALARAGLEVVFVEEGAPYPPAARRRDAWSAFNAAWRDGSFQVARGRAVTPILQGSAVGGATPINGAIIHRMPAPILHRWHRDFGLSEVLPRAELERVWDDLDAALGVAPTPPAAWGGNNSLFKQGVDATGLNATPTHRAVVGCRRTARCTQGCPTAAKQSLDHTLLAEAQGLGARILATARVQRLQVGGGRVLGVSGHAVDPVTKVRGAPFTVHARRAVLLAAGAIHTPLLLKAHRIGPRRHVGRGLRCHPGASIVARFPQRVGLFDGATQGMECTSLWAERIKFETVGVPPAVLASRLPGVGADFTTLLAQADHLAHWGVQVRAQARGTVRRAPWGKPWIAWQLTPRDVALLKRGLRHLCAFAFAAGAEAVLPGVHGLPTQVTDLSQLDALDTLPDDPRLLHCICAHLFGTAALGQGPTQGAVDGEGRPFGGPAGLVVVDASVFPTNLGVNPQHSISAVAWLLAERLAGRLEARRTGAWAG